MKLNAIMEECRKLVTPDIKKQVNMSVDIANRIYDLLEEKGITQKDFAQLMGKTEPEISRWLQGTHNFTLTTIAKISVALGKDIITVANKEPRVIQPLILMSASYGKACTIQSPHPYSTRSYKKKQEICLNN